MTIEQEPQQGLDVIQNRIKTANKTNHLNGICDLIVRYNVGLDELESYFLNLYKPKQARLAQKRGNRSVYHKRVDQAKRALKSRWERYDELRTSHIDKDDEKRQRVEAVPKPKLSDRSNQGEEE